MAYLLQQILNAVPQAMLYATLAFGYALIFGMTRRVDITYGALFAFAGQIFVLFTDRGWSTYYWVLPAALGLGAAASLAYTLGSSALIARHVMRPLSNASLNAVLVASVGVLLLLTETARLASDAREIWLSPFLNRRLIVMRDGDGFAASLTLIQLLNSVLMLALLLAGAFVMERSQLGRIWKAVSDDRQAARFCGVDTDRVFLVACLAASCIACFAACLATSYYGTMDFSSGLVFGVKVALIAAAGGQSRPLHAALGGVAVAFAETLWSGYGPMVWRDFVVTGGLVLLLVVSRRERIIP
ncbi:branched-chain amino acid ABC transporter permease [Allorhizobium sp. BGMRC 0089]|uniref:branched-chain amino acid ABC transporter permease n=1 Tax=Allorhizobium sonneratiae TaxID=2934936 RepID=UPI002034A4F5|nr:branched-chain amino acid ABC transporter permease [Allorhizobium sonneratiae]MCM2292074.1 branched-chain amino acid ABC transporter permease [Allorhizobium sonneratiae]